jgi:hypothetical protein
MAEESLLTITLATTGDGFRADLHAPSGLNGIADLRLRGSGHTAMEAIETCMVELESLAADGDEIALRFT